jgi:choline-sulfatase
MVDEMAAKAVGCYGNTVVKTPHIDRLAARGVRFSNAYATSPICIPARAAFATGRYPHQTGYWDNVFAYDGAVRGWGHRLRDAGHRITTIGKLHYQDALCDAGIDEQILPMHVHGGGDIFGLEREHPPLRPQSASVAAEVAAGESQYTRYDAKITLLTEAWFATRLKEQGDKPWVVFTSFIAPHFPLTVPRDYLDRYDLTDIALPGKSLNTEGPLGDWWKLFTYGYDFDRYFRDDEHRRRALMHYFALCAFADDNVGRVIAALEASGQADNTTILLLSDHGDNMGARGLWGKSTMYEESVNVPMILIDPDLSPARVCETPVSLVDGYQTILDAVGVELTSEERALPGASLLEIAARPYDAERQVFSEYHASCAPTGLMMLRRGCYKYIHYTAYGVELFDLEADPEELTNLADDPAYADVLTQFDRDLRAIVDPEATDRCAKATQRARMAELGGLDAIVAKGGVTHTPPPGEEASVI